MMSKPASEQDLLRKAFRDYWQGYREHANSPGRHKNKGYPMVPAALTGLTCGAKTRAGTPCKRTDLYWSGRCKFHGGLSTGPTTEIGKAKARDNGKLGGRGRALKPNPLKPLRQSNVCEVHPGTMEENLEPDPMETGRMRLGSAGISSDVAARFTDDPSSATDGKDSGTENHVSKPNPMDSSQNLTFHREKTGTPAIAVNLTKPVLLNAKDGNVSVRVQCKNCSNISAGFSCLSPNSGQSLPDLGEWRICKQYA